MNTLAAMKQALDALEYGFVDEPFQGKEKAAIISLKIAIAEFESKYCSITSGFVQMPIKPDYALYQSFEKAIGHTSMFVSTFDRCYAAMISEIQNRG